MTVYVLTITIDDEGTGDADAARDEIVGSIEDARDSDELGGCLVEWDELTPVLKHIG